MEGDVDVSQRKGKVITLFDVKLQLEYSGETAEKEEVTGTITIPEVAHDTEEDEYVVRSLGYTPRPKFSHLADLHSLTLTLSPTNLRNNL
jgi:Activator of Hsp90 ATPase, N-terminal